MKRLLIASLLLTGCVPTETGRKPNPQPEAPPLPAQKEVVHLIKVVVTHEGEGRVVVSGDGVIDLRSNASSPTQCRCGCNQDGCECDVIGDIRGQTIGENIVKRSGTVPPIKTRDRPGNALPPVATGGNGNAADISNDLSAGKVFNKPLKTNRDIFVLGVEGCAACDLAAADMRKLGFDVHVVYGQQARQYPTLKNRRGDVYEIDDGYWNTGNDDIRAAKKLAQ